MGDAVLRVQRHLREFARDHFARQEAAHGANVDWLRAELAALSRDVGAALRRELKRPLPAVFRSNEYAFAAKRARVEAPRTPEPAAPVSAPVSAPVPAPPVSPPVTAPPVSAPVSAPVEAAATVPAKKLVRRIRRVMRPKAATRGAGSRQRLDPVSMRVVELRAELKRRGLKAAGLKAVLVDRLLEAMERDDESDEEDDVVELEEVDEEYDEEADEELEEVGSGDAASRAAHASSAGREPRDEIVRESIDLSQRSIQDESLSLSQSSDARATGANTKRPRTADTAAISEDNEDTQSTQGEESQMHEVVPEQVHAIAAAKKPAFAAGASRRGVSSGEVQSSRVTPAKRSADSAAGETNTSGMSLDTRRQDTVEVLDNGSRLLEASYKPSRSTIAGESAAERKASLKVSFAAKRGDASAPETQTDFAHAEPSVLRSSSAEDPVARLRSISLPQASVSAAADPVTPNGQGTAGELLVARSEPGPGALDETEDEQQQREHQLTIEREAQRLRIAAKLSAKKRFEEAMLSSSFWAKRDRSKVQQQQPEPVLEQPAKDALAEEKTASPSRVAIKVEPEAEAATMDPPFVAASATSDPSYAAQTSLKPEPSARSKEVKIPFSSSNRRFSDPSRRVSASRRRESASSRRDSTSSRRESVSSRRNSLMRRRDSGSSTLSSDSTKSGSGSQKTDAGAATGNRKPTNLVSGLHSFTSLMEKENASASTSASARSAPVVSALKMAEKSRLLEQKKNLEKTKRKEALMKKYEEQRKLDDDKKKKAISVKEKAERDAKLKREQDKLNEKKQREIELAKRRHQKLQEMRAGLEKKRAMLAAEKQAGAAKLAAQAASTAPSSSSTRRTSTSSVSTQAPRSTTAAQVPAPKPSSVVVVTQVPPKQSAPSQAAHATAGVSKSAKPSASAQPPKAAAPHAVSAATTVTQAAKEPSAPPHAKERPTDTSTYDMSDNGESSDGDGDDSDDSDKQNKKNIPRWARKENLERILRVQFGPNASDPSPAIFPDFVDTCDLEAIFQPTDVRKKKRFQKRSSSGNWFGDRPTAREKAIYKRDMGYLR